MYIYTNKKDFNNYNKRYAIWLQKYLLYCAWEYYYGEPVITDSEYDELIGILEYAQECFPEIKDPKSITQIIAPDPKSKPENPGEFKDDENNTAM